MAKLLESVLNQVLQAQATEQIKAEPYERTKEREDYRNGYLQKRIGHKGWEYSIARFLGLGMGNLQLIYFNVINGVNRHYYLP